MSNIFRDVDQIRYSAQLAWREGKSRRARHLNALADRVEVADRYPQAAKAIATRIAVLGLAGAWMLAANVYEADAASISVTNQWYSISGSVLGDMNQAPPNFVNGSTLQNGAPAISNGSAYFASVGNGNELMWWTPGYVSAFNGPAATSTTNGNTFSVNSNGGSLAPGAYTEKEVITFSNATAVTEPLTLTGNGDFVLFENNAEILSHDATGSSFTSSIGETLNAGVNTLTVFSAWSGQSGAPLLIVDPSFSTAAAAPTPEIGTLAMLGIGGAFLAFGGHRRMKNRLGSLA